jgi:phospholipase/lecithinase/hemolysin
MGIAIAIVVGILLAAPLGYAATRPIFLGIDKMAGNDFAAGLANPKATAESRAAVATNGA